MQLISEVLRELIFPDSKPMTKRYPNPPSSELLEVVFDDHQKVILFLFREIDSCLHRQVAFREPSSLQFSLDQKNIIKERERSWPYLESKLI